MLGRKVQLRRHLAAVVDARHRVHWDLLHRNGARGGVVAGADAVPTAFLHRLSRRHRDIALSITDFEGNAA